MKILAVCDRYPTSMQTWFINYLEAMEVSGGTPEILSLSPGERHYHPRVDRIKSQKVSIYWSSIVKDFTSALFFFAFGGKAVPVLSIFRRLRREGCTWKELMQGFRGIHLYSCTNIDIVHCHSEGAAFRTLPLLKLLDKPIVLTFHGLPPQGVPDILTRHRRILVGNISSLITNTQFAADQYRSLINNNFPIRCLKQGINIDDFPYSPHHFPRRFSPVKFLTISRLDRLKGHTLVIDAMRQLINDGYNCYYTIVGAGYFKQDLERYIVDMALADRVTIQPPALGSKLLSYFSDHDVFILPSFTEEGQWAETQGIVIQEAQASGMPIVASDSGGIPECVIDGEDVLLFRQASSEELSNRLTELLSSEELWKHLVHQGRRNVEEFYSLAAMGKELLSLYRSLLDTPEPGQ